MKTASSKDLRKQYAEYCSARPCSAWLHWRAESFRASEGKPMTIRRALALNAVLQNVDTRIFPGEWILGSDGPARMASGGTIDDAQLIIDKQFLAAIGKRDFGSNLDHHAPGHDVLLREGFGGLLRLAKDSLSKAASADEKTFMESMVIALEGAMAHTRRWADAAAEAPVEDSDFKEILKMQVDGLKWIIEKPPRTFWEAIELVYLYHTMMQMDERSATAFGRLDQFLYPFYASDKAAKRLDDETAQEILVHFFEKITVVEDTQNIAVGGVKPADGTDATNELSYMILEACKLVGRPGGNVTARIHKGTSLEFLIKCGEVIRTGIGYPALFNDEVEIPALIDQGYPLEEARDYCFVGCIEVSIPGRTAPWSDSRFNLLYCVNLALYDGVDSLTGKRVGPATGELRTFDEFYEAVLVQMRELLNVHINALTSYKQRAKDKARELTSPLMSALVADCIERRRDLNDGGARWPCNHGVAGMGIGVTSDSLMAIKRFVYDKKRFTLPELRQILSDNFKGFQRERQLMLKDAPKYGNDDPEVDAIAVRVTRDFAEECMKSQTPTGGRYWGFMAANVANIAAGKEVGATADGRLALQPLSDAASPTFGRDKHGPTAALRSISKLPYRLCPGGNVINMKLHPSTLKGVEGVTAFAHLIRTCFELGGIQLQFNTIDRATLEEAMARPAEHEDLVTRVSGFSARFVLLDRQVQEDILARMEHTTLS